MGARSRIAWVAVLCLLVVGGVFLVWRIAPGPTPQVASTTDTTKPTITLTTEQTLLTNISGKLTLSVNATDNTGINHVEYKIDGRLVASSYQYPFGATLDLAGYTAGPHTLTITAYDSAGNASAPIVQTLTVAGATGPTPATAPVSNTTQARSTWRSIIAVISQSTNIHTPTPDTTPPTVPANLAVSQSGEHTVSLSWDASADDVGVSVYQVYRNGTLLGTSTTTAYADTTALPGSTYTYQVRAADSSGNQSALTSQVSITLAALTIFSAVDTPPASAQADSASVELGMHIRPTHDGYITGVRFYKNTGSTGTHIGHLWSSGGSSLASVTFTNESATGWQTATFSSPVAVTAGTDYVVSYFAPNGGYSATADQLAYSHLSSEYFIAPASGDGGNNGLYGYTSSPAFPTSSFNTTNYWVDAMYVPTSLVADAPSRSCPAYPAFPDASCTGTIPGSTFMSYTGTLTILHDNMTIQNLDITGQVSIRANNVTLSNCKIHGAAVGGVTINSGSLTLKDSELYGFNSQALGFSSWSGYRLNIHTMLDDGVKFGNNVVLEDSYIHDFTPVDGAHADGGQMQNGVTNVTIRHNNINIPNGNSALFMAPDLGPSNTGPVLIDRNLLGGGSYTMAILDGNNGVYHESGYTITNNHFLRNYTYGAININEPAGSFVLWSNNSYDDNGVIIPSPY